MASMSIALVMESLKELLLVPAELANGTPVNYSFDVEPAERYNSDVSSVTWMEFKSDVNGATCPIKALSRPMSQLSLWLTATKTTCSDSEKIRSNCRPIISSPQLMSQTAAQTDSSTSVVDHSGDQFSDAELEALLDDLQIPEGKRQSIHELSVEKRTTLLEFEKRTVKYTNPSSVRRRSLEIHQYSQHNLFAPVAPQSTSDNSREAHVENKQCGLPFIPDLSPRRTSCIKEGQVLKSNTFSSSPAKTERARSRSPIRLNMSTCPPKIDWESSRSPIRAQRTGSSWMSNWWHRSDQADDHDHAESYISRLQLHYKPSNRLLNEVVTLRVHLGTARASWLTIFISHNGLGTLRIILEKNPVDSCDLTNALWYECLKCFRILLNSQIGFEAIIADDSIIAEICKVSHRGQFNVKTMAFDLLAGICTASPTSGHRKVFQTLVEPTIDVFHGRFSNLTSLLLPTYKGSIHSKSFAELLRACLTLLISLVSCWDDLEDRILLRLELFSRVTRSTRSYLNSLSEDIQVQLRALDELIFRDREAFRASLVETVSGKIIYKSGERLCSTRDEESWSGDDLLSVTSDEDFNLNQSINDSFQRASSRNASAAHTIPDKSGHSTSQEEDLEHTAAFIDPVGKMSTNDDSSGFSMLALPMQSTLGSPLPTPPPPPPPPAPPLPPVLNTLYSSGLALRKVLPLPPAQYDSRKAPVSHKNLKPIFWEKLPGKSLANTIWSVVSQKIENGLHQELMMSDFEKYFAKATTTREYPYAKCLDGIQRSGQKVTLIDHQRSKNIEVMLASIKLSHAAIREALIRMDDQKLGSVDQLRIMHRNVPSHEEFSLINEYDGDVELLAPAERYIFELKEIPRLRERLEAIIFKRKFHIEYAEIRPELEILSKSCQEIMSCKSLQEILALALTAGNILNATTFRGNAEGFRLEGLIKLGDVRSSVQSKSGTTLVHYLVAVLEKKWHQKLILSEELPNCAMAARSKYPESISDLYSHAK